MFSLRRASILVVTVIVLSVFAVPSIVHAQDATPAATGCDPKFGSDAGTIYTNVAAALKSGTSKGPDFAQMGLDLSATRQQYEDLATTPEGCETVRGQLVQLSAIYEDIVMLNLMAVLDTKNVANYQDFSAKAWQPHFDAFKASTTATPSATPADASAAAAACTDAAFQAQLPADLKTMPTPDFKDAASLGSTLLNAIKLRYQYEAATAPAGCELARKDMVKVLSFTEDLLLAAAGSLADPAKATQFTNFYTTINTRGQTLYTTMLADAGIGAATPAATEASDG